MELAVCCVIGRASLCSMPWAMGGGSGHGGGVTGVGGRGGGGRGEDSISDGPARTGPPTPLCRSLSVRDCGQARVRPRASVSLSVHREGTVSYTHSTGKRTSVGPATEQSFQKRSLSLHVTRTDGIEAGAREGGRDGEGHGGPGQSPEAARGNFLQETSQARPSSPVGIADFWGEHQSPDGDGSHISPGAPQMKTQTPATARSLRRRPGGFEKAGRH